MKRPNVQLEGSTKNFNFNHPTKCRQGPPLVKPKCGQLEVKHHRLPKHHKQDRKLKCPVCSSVFNLIKDIMFMYVLNIGGSDTFVNTALGNL